MTITAKTTTAKTLLVTTMLALMSLTIMVASCKTNAETDGDAQTPKTGTPPVPEGRPLREIAQEKFPDNGFIVGVTCGLWAFDYPAGEIVDREFSYVTPENDFKQSSIHPENGNWNFSGADTWLEHIAKNGQILRMHCPIGPQVSDWAEDDKRTAEELKTNMTEYLTAVCDRYNGKPGVAYMDVVNETVVDGAWFGPKLGAGANMWENPWPIIGTDTDKNATPLYIKMAFQIANEHASAIKLLYNHHEGPEKTASWELIKETVLYLKSAGLRVDAIGWQSHVDNGWATEANLQALGNLIDWAQANGLEFHVTEASSFIKNKATAEELDLQAKTYSAIFEVLLNKSKTGIVGWNTWHLTDAYTYRDEYQPALFDKDNQAKPAYYAIQKSLENFR